MAHNRSLTSIALFVTLLIAVLFVISPGTAASIVTAPTSDGASAADMPNVAPPRPGELNEAQLQDLSTMAAQEGISLAEAIERYAWHESFSMLANDIRQKHPDSFAGAMIVPDGAPWIAFKSKPPEGVATMVAEFATINFSGSNRTVDLILDRGFTEAELDDRLIKAHYAAYKQIGLVAKVASGYDIETGEVTVEIEPVAPIGSQAERSAFVDGVIGANEAVFDDVTVRVVDEVIGGVEMNIYGGHRLSHGTSGFGVRSGSTRGLATAGHVTNHDLRYPVSGPDVRLNVQDEHEGSWGDFQWATSIATERDDFFSGPFTTNLRDVSGTGFPALGQKLCKNGKITGSGCEYVYKLNQCFNGTCRLVAMHRHITAVGDSGGPWFYGNTAYGIHMGVKTIWFRSRSLFSPVSYIDEAIGVTIATW